MKQAFRRGFRGDRGESLGSAQRQAPDQAIVVAEAAGDEAGMQAVDDRRPGAEAARQLAGEQDIRKLRALVGAPAAVAVALHLEIVEIELRAAMGTRRDIDDAGAR